MPKHNEFAEQPFTARRFFAQPIRMVLVALRELGRGKGCRSADRGAGERRQG